MVQNENCQKYEEWSWGFVTLICSLYSIGFLIGLYFSYDFSKTVVVGYLLISALNLFSVLSTTCRHCYYYGKRCYFGIGLIVPYFFEKREDPISIVKEGIWFIILLINLLYPVFFVFKAHPVVQSIMYSAGYLFFPVSVMFLVNKYSCPKCKNEGCLMNPDRKDAKIITI